MENPSDRQESSNFCMKSHLHSLRFESVPNFFDYAFSNRQKFMAEFYDRSSMEFESYPCDTPVLSPEDAFDPLVRLDSPKGFERFSFSVVYQAFDFPFPLIHYPHQSPDSLDSQFSVGCIHGGGSMLSSLDVSVESCLGMF